jgi:RNA polymerase-binding transcription factor DksA
MKELGYYKEKLEKESQALRDELSTVGVENPNTPADWEPKPENIDIMDADLNEAADRIEAQQESQGILDGLEARYQNVTRALKKMEQNTFGTCEICGNEIEEDRLEAMPSARTCKAHLENERELSL